MNIEERVKIAVLTKYYGKLLTEKQAQVVSMYVDNNLSLAEVGSELGISRQAVKALLDVAHKTLLDYEKKLQFVVRDDKIKKILKENKPDSAKKVLTIMEG